MSERPMTDAAHIAAPHSGEYDPFRRQSVEGPGRRFWADRNVWGVYKASLLLAAEEERTRCAEIVRSYARQAPDSIRDHLFDVVKKIEMPIST